MMPKSLKAKVLEAIEQCEDDIIRNGGDIPYNLMEELRRKVGEIFDEADKDTR